MSAPPDAPSATGADRAAAHVAAAAALLDLPLHPDWVGPVSDNMRVLAAAAGLLADFPLPDEAEAAPVFAA